LRLYRWTIRQLSGSLTPWHSDTLFGHCCWLIAESEGADALSGMLAACAQGRPPFLFSDGFPAGFLPMPCGGQFVRRNEAADKARQLEGMKQAKRFKKARFVTTAAFGDIACGRAISAADIAEPEVFVWSQLHNTISRETGATLEGGLFAEIESYAPRMDIYVLADDGWESRLGHLLERLEQKGFGAKITRGKGRFTTESFGPCDDIPAPAVPSGFMTLSRCLPSADMPVAAQYRLYVKYGRLGGWRSADRPFKRPVVMLEPGAVFWTDRPIRRWYGRLATDIHPDYPDAVQCGMAIALPCRIAPPEYLEESDADGA
jgi:CRISPR-associated protein Csm4